MPTKEQKVFTVEKLNRVSVRAEIFSRLYQYNVSFVLVDFNACCKHALTPANRGISEIY